MRYAALALALLACKSGPSAEQIVHQHQAEGLQKVRALEEVGRLAAQAPPVDRDALALGDAHLDFAPGKPNAGFIQLEDFRDLAKLDHERLRLDVDPFWPDAVSLLRTGRDAWGRKPENATWVRSQLTGLEGIRYLFVVRTHEYVRPTAAGDGRFTPGSWSGDVVVFDTERRAERGGLRFSVATPDDVPVMVDRKAPPDKQKEQMESWLRSNLWEQARAQVGAAVARLAPGTRWP